MNIRLLKQIKAAILKEPKQFVMSDWFTKYMDWTIPNCGTAACIGGWAIALANKVNPEEAKEIFLREENNEQTPEKLLKLTGEQEDKLFYHSNWPERFQFKSTDGALARAKKAAKRIDHFIETEGAE